MLTKINQISADALSRYSEIPMSLQVESVFRIEAKENGLSGMELYEEKVEHPYTKDYDAAKGEGPTRWLKRFDMSKWGIFIAFQEEQHVGGAIVAPGEYLGDLDKQFCQLFDIRVLADRRRNGIGSKLLQRVANWSQECGGKYLKIETQNTNVPACRFYAKQGCKLGSIDVHAYASYPKFQHEIRLVWYLEL